MVDKQDAPVDATRRLPFVLATLCSLPFATGLGFYAAYLLTRKELFVDCVVMACMFGWPVLGLLAIAGVGFIVFSWMHSVRACRVWLAICTLCILGFTALGYAALTGLGPL